MSKNSIIIALSTLLLIVSLFYNVSQKKSYKKVSQEAIIENSEVTNVAQLQSLWTAKGITTKISNILKNIPNDKRAGTKLERTKAKLNFSNLADNELNKLLSSLAKLPIQFKNLNITRNGEKYSMECLCVW